MRVLRTLCCAAVIAATTAPAAHAQNWVWSKKTFLTFSGPVQIPGKTLPAGTYTFQVADLLANRHVVQILDQDEKSIIATVMTVPRTAVETSENNVVMFSERPAGSAPAIQIWRYPGTTTGNEFVYPRQQAIEIARAAHTGVLARNDEGTTDEAMKSATVTRIDERGEPVNDDETRIAGGTASTQAPPQRDAQTQTQAPAQTQAQTQAPASSPASVGTSGQRGAAAADRDAAAPQRRRELPRTASQLALFELISALSMAAYLAVRHARKSQDAA